MPTLPQTPTERGAMLHHYLTQQPLTAEQAATLLDVSLVRAQHILEEISRVTPVYYDARQHVWRICRLYPENVG